MLEKIKLEKNLRTTKIKIFTQFFWSISFIFSLSFKSTIMLETNLLLPNIMEASSIVPSDAGILVFMPFFVDWTKWLASNTQDAENW